uniref:Uncharacterized protein n=1 Tax=Anguilla anguilla TaxID=7936 RepID=A0A0E9WQS8_ANGAN
MMIVGFFLLFLIHKHYRPEKNMHHRYKNLIMYHLQNKYVKPLHTPEANILQNPWKYQSPQANSLWKKSDTLGKQACVCRLKDIV